MLSVAALLLVISWGWTGAQVHDGRCEKITIPLCTGMKYNMTRMPNLVGISNQNDAALQVRRAVIGRSCSSIIVVKALFVRRGRRLTELSRTITNDSVMMMTTTMI